MVMEVGVDLFEDAMEAQVLYLLKRTAWRVWRDKIIKFCKTGKAKVYAENTLNELNGFAHIHIIDVKDHLCSEIDNPEDLAVVSEGIKTLEN